MGPQGTGGDVPTKHRYFESVDHCVVGALGRLAGTLQRRARNLELGPDRRVCRRRGPVRNGRVAFRDGWRRSKRWFGSGRSRWWRQRWSAVGWRWCWWCRLGDWRDGCRRRYQFFGRRHWPAHRRWCRCEHGGLERRRCRGLGRCCREWRGRRYGKRSRHDRRNGRWRSDSVRQRLRVRDGERVQRRHVLQVRTAKRAVPRRLCLRLDEDGARPQRLYRLRMSTGVRMQIERGLQRR